MKHERLLHAAVGRGSQGEGSASAGDEALGGHQRGSGRGEGRGHGHGEGRGEGHGRRSHRVEGRVLGRGELPLVILALLAETPRHGYDLIRCIEERCGGAYAPSAGVVYPTLTMLEEQAFTTADPSGDTGKRRYVLTDVGRRYVADNDGPIQLAFARLDKVARMRAREALPPRVAQAMETLKRALLASGTDWDDVRAERVAVELEKAACAIAPPSFKGNVNDMTATAHASTSTSTDNAVDRPVAATANAAPDYTSQRVRHELVRRLLTVVRTERVSAHILRVTLTGDELHGFYSGAFDDHIKIFLPRDGQRVPVMPDLSDLKKRVENEADRPIARDYTPRRYDAAANELDIEFVIHGDGPGSRWAERAKPGDLLGVAGPRGSFVISAAFDWYLLVGDETAMPAIGRRIEELPDDASALVIVEAASPQAIPAWPSRPNVRVHPVYRGDAHAGTSDCLLQAVRAATLPDGVGHAWVATESVAAKQIRAHLVDDRGIDKKHVRASSYWRQGDVSHHENLDD